MNKWKVAAGIPLVFGVALAACSGSGSGTAFENGGPCPNKTPPGTQDDADMSAEELTDLVAEAITCDGYALHVGSSGDFDAGPYSFHMDFESWTAVAPNMARRETTITPPDEEVAEADAGGEGPADRSTTIVRSGGSYSSQEPDEPASKGQVANCHNEGQEALIFVVPCNNGPLQEIDVSIEMNATYDGKDAIAHVATGESRGHDQTYNLTTRTYYDAESLLPLGQTSEGTLDIGEVHPVDFELRYVTAFVPLDSLPADFFDPASIGYVETDLEEPLDDAEIDIYWIGREFEGRDEYPALAIRHATARPRSQTGGGSVAQIAYRSADDEFGRIWVRIDLFTPEAFEFRDGETVLNECEETIAVDILGGQATIRRHHNGRGQNPDGSCNPPDRYSAVVRFEDVVVDIDAPSTGNGKETFPSPYNTEAAMELLIQGLELRE